MRCFPNPPTSFQNASDIANKCKSGILFVSDRTRSFPFQCTSMQFSAIDIGNKCKSGVFRTRRPISQTQVILVINARAVFSQPADTGNKSSARVILVISSKCNCSSFITYYRALVGYMSGVENIQKTHTNTHRRTGRRCSIWTCRTISSQCFLAPAPPITTQVCIDPHEQSNIRPICVQPIVLGSVASPMNPTNK